MLSFGPLAFTLPWLLLGLLVLPLLWWLMRLMPPAPRRIPFAAIRLLFGLRGEETTPQATPWWLVLLRLMIAALIVVTAARPVLNPDWTLEGEGAVILAIDDGWAAAPDWPMRLERAAGLLNTAERAGRPVYLVLGAAPDDGNPLEPVRLVTSQVATEIVAALQPKPWPVDRAAMTEAVADLRSDGITGDVFWLTDGLETAETSDFAEALAALGPLTVLQADMSLGPLVMTPPDRGEAMLSVTLKRPVAVAPLRTALVAYSESGRPLYRAEAEFPAGEVETTATLDMPLELRNEAARLVLEDQSGAAASVLLDERWARRPVGIIADIGNREALPLLSEIYFLDRALRPLGTIDRGSVGVLLKVPQSVLLLPDETVLESDDTDQLTDWVEDGGMLVRFAGPRLAADVDVPLIPVKLRGGGRQLSGAMLWTEPARIGRMSPDGPFAGMELPKDVSITRQVLAEPSLDLDDRTWMRLADDTPLVTAAQRGKGWLVLIHTTANTEWSDMALSGLFVDMLARLSSLGRGVQDAAGDQGLAQPYRLLDGFGRLIDPQNSARPLDVATLETAAISASNPPGYYGTDAVRVAINLGDRVPALAPLETLPEGTVLAGYRQEAEQPLAPYLLLAAFFLLLADSLIMVYLRGFRLRRSPVGIGSTAAMLCLVLLSLSPDQAAAQESIPPGARTTTLAYVITGDAEIDRTSAAGLRSLSNILVERTAVEAGEPVGIDIERDELAFYPLLYWPVLEQQGNISAPTADRINRFMASGGTILFDTRDGHLANSRFRSASDTLRRLARNLNIPQIAAVPPDHVLTRSFYLMQDFPGRWTGGAVWVETGTSGSNDGVSPIIVGDADWAAAWAKDDLGRPLVALGGDDTRQREMAYRFGVNLVMYTLTGNYKSDQVHIPSILERLGQ